MHASNPTHSMLKAARRRMTSFVLGAVLVGSATSATAGPFGFFKIAAPTWYIQVAVHGNVGAAALHGVFPQPGPFWATPFFFQEAAPAAGDVMRGAGRARHIVAPHPGDAPLGPIFAWACFFNSALLPIGITSVGGAAIAAHPGIGHIDAFATRTSVLVFPPGNILAYAHVDLALHFGVPRICGGTLAGTNSVPSNNSQAMGTVQMALDMESGKYFLGIGVMGLSRTQITASHLHRGPAGTNGPVVLDIGAGSAYQDLDGGGIYKTVGDTPFPTDLISDYLAGNLYLNIHTPAFPGGEIRAQLTPEGQLPPTVSGHINFRGRIGAPPSMLDFDYKDTTMTTVATIPGVVEQDASFGVPTPGTAAPLFISTHPTPYLRRTVGPINPGVPTENVTFDLIPGDVDGDNEVSLTDYARLAAGFGAAPGDPNWDQNTDLNADDETNLADYSLLSQAFGLAGDD